MMISGMMCLAFGLKAQVIPFKSKAAEREKAESFVYQNIHDQYDLVLAYTQFGYWNSNIKSYALLAFKNGNWYKGSLYSKRNKHNQWSKPKLKFKKAETSKVLEIIDHLNAADLWGMSRDSLNIRERKNKDSSVTKLTISDDNNYSFEVFDKNDFAIIESYAPEYFLEELPENMILQRFIKVRDWFRVNFKAL
jgi:hypothetical protein